MPEGSTGLSIPMCMPKIIKVKPLIKKLKSNKNKLLANSIECERDGKYSYRKLAACEISLGSTRFHGDM